MAGSSKVSLHNNDIDIGTLFHILLCTSQDSKNIVIFLKSDWHSSQASESVKARPGYREILIFSAHVLRLDTNESWNLKEKRCTQWSPGPYSLLCSVNKSPLTWLIKRVWREKQTIAHNLVCFQERACLEIFLYYPPWVRMDQFLYDKILPEQ